MHPWRVIFICTGNSARSILFEATLNHLGARRFEAFSAGSRPTGRVHPAALAQLAAQGISTEGLASKSWDRFAEAGAAQLDIVITVCGHAANESCPVFPGNFMRSHWGLPDPATADGAEALAEAFRHTHQLIIRRITALLELPLAGMQREELQRVLDQIGTIDDDEAAA